METWLAERYISSKIPIPGQLLQSVIDVWLRTSTFVESIKQTMTSSEPGVAVDAEADTAPLAPRSQELMRVHYELPIALMEACLGKTMKYSMGLWGSKKEGLDASQTAMMEDLCKKAQLYPGVRVLDIGCGFGSLAGFILQNYPESRVYGLNLSTTHCQYIQNKVKTAGHPLNSDRFTLLQSDFNIFMTDLKFDRVLSVGFFEHVHNLGGALQKIQAMLAPAGLCFLHYIVRNEHTSTSIHQKSSESFIQHYVFPGSRIHGFHDLYRHQRDLLITKSWFMNGSHYQKTLEEWLHNFHSNMKRMDLNHQLDDNMLKVWELYLRSCIAIFQLKDGTSYGNGQYLLEARSS